MVIDKKEKEIIRLLIDLVDNHYDDQIKTIRQFKHLCKLPQAGKEYEKNMLVFNIQDKAVEDKRNEQREAIEFLRKLLNQPQA